mmetsp:Transcript_123919/g.309722  ORF Transcript_123919/g.309722 Transcript_123919/m.309722 type:complete len:206 (-) Transcript_123919:140-757(-)
MTPRPATSLRRRRRQPPRCDTVPMGAKARARLWRLRLYLPGHPDPLGAQPRSSWPTALRSWHPSHRAPPPHLEPRRLPLVLHRRLRRTRLLLPWRQCWVSQAIREAAASRIPAARASRRSCAPLLLTKGIAPTATSAHSRTGLMRSRASSRDCASSRRGSAPRGTSAVLRTMVKRSRAGKRKCVGTTPPLAPRGSSVVSPTARRS